MPQALAHIGFTTTVLESVATSIGAGMLLSGFVAAATGLVRGWTRRDLEARAFRDACIGGIAACGFLILDLGMRYLS